MSKDAYEAAVVAAASRLRTTPSATISGLHDAIKAAIDAFLSRAAQDAPGVVGDTQMWANNHSDDETRAAFREAADTILALTAERERLRAALAPFATMNPHRPPEGVSPDQWRGDVNRAVAALKEPGNG